MRVLVLQIEIGYANFFAYFYCTFMPKNWHIFIEIQCFGLQVGRSMSRVLTLFEDFFMRFWFEWFRDFSMVKRGNLEGEVSVTLVSNKGRSKKVHSTKVKFILFFRTHFTDWIASIGCTSWSLTESASIKIISLCRFIYLLDFVSFILPLCRDEFVFFWPAHPLDFFSQANQVNWALRISLWLQSHLYDRNGNCYLKIAENSGVLEEGT